MKRNDILCIAIAGSFGCVGMTACERAETPTEETPTTPAPQTAQDVEEVAEEPQDFYGKTVKEQPEKEKHASAQQQDQKSKVAFEAQGGMLTPEGETISVETFATSPGEYTGRAVQGQAKVLDVPSDRGFWLEMPEGEKVFALIHEEDPEHQRIDINPGDQVKFTAIALEPKLASELPLPIEKDAEEALEGQKAFLAVHWKDIEKVSQPQ